MQLHNPTLLNKLAKRLAFPLSRVLCSKLLLVPARAADAYLNFLLGRGAGTGWDIEQEIRAARGYVHRAKPVVFDVGANIGIWSQHAMEAMPDARIYMFEPSPDCQLKIQSANLSPDKLVPCAVGERSGKATLHSSSATDGSASLYERVDSYFMDREYINIEVEVVTLDDVIETEKLDFVDFLKLDIEGHELFALRGAKKTLAEKRIGALSFEFGSGNINSRTFFQDFWNLLSAAGFRIWRITPGGIPILIDRYYEDLEYFRGVSNYVAELLHHPYK